ncbi:elicitin [Phytophthora sojae]|uniref:Elicitin n=2 Tax=Phytophthora sojae TaxID=67593 RepID=G4Z2G0_PHYSP|nr:elicitin [Phytophthora sojae]ABB56016.1 elicitin-like protein SOL13I [Phytophthora sojae]EGZ20001.1 elicitin [Phytophthora sojae]|eukprot:XP_009522718.1 elicitin [Phytophthora sojae]
MHFTVLFVVAAALFSAAVPVNAFETCSDADNEQLIELYSTAAETSACAPYSTFMPIGTAAIYWPCDATDCQEVMAQVASGMPDCWYMGNNQKETLQEAVDRCAGETPDWTTSRSSNGGGDSAPSSKPSSSPSSEATDDEATTRPQNPSKKTQDQLQLRT